MFDDLNERQQKFVLAYIDSGIGYKSAIAAGYSEKTAPQQSSELLSNPKIKAAIKQKMDEIDAYLRHQFKRSAENMFKVIEEIANNPDGNARDRYTAAKDLLDRAGHKATDKQEISGSEGGPVVVRFTDPE